MLSEATRFRSYTVRRGSGRSLPLFLLCLLFLLPDQGTIRYSLENKVVFFFFRIRTVSGRFRLKSYINTSIVYELNSLQSITSFIFPLSSPLSAVLSSFILTPFLTWYHGFSEKSSRILHLYLCGLTTRRYGYVKLRRAMFS